MHRQVLAQRQHKRAAAQRAQHQGQMPPPAERGQGQRHHARPHVQAVRQRDVVEARLRDPSGRGLKSIAVAHTVRSHKLDQSGRMKRASLGIGPRERCGPFGRAFERVRGHECDRADPSGQRGSEDKDTQPAGTEAHASRIATALQHRHRDHRGQRKTHPHHGHKDFANQQAKGGG